MTGTGYADEVNRRWEWLMTNSDALFIVVVVKAASEPRLRALFPFRSLNELHFSRVTEYPYDLDLPFIEITPDGSHHARAGSGAPLLDGDLDQVVRCVAEGVLVGREGD